MIVSNKKFESFSSVASGGYGTNALLLLMNGYPVPATLSALWACKPVRETITRLIFASTEIPEAWLRNKKLMIEERGKMERQVVQGFSNEVQNNISVDTSIKERANIYAKNKMDKFQESRESIAQKTLEQLSKLDITHVESSPSEDFMRSFESIAEKTSSEELQDMMSRILAGEIRQPGSISRATLSVSEILDKKIIESMLFIKPYLISNSWICCDSLSVQQFNEHANLLQSVAITTEMGGKTYGFGDGGYAIHSYKQGAILIKLKDGQSPYKFAPHTDGFNLTRSGLELMPLLPEEKTVSIQNICESYKKNKFLGEVFAGKINEIGQFIKDIT